MKLLLHCCCAPCALSCVGQLCKDGIEPGLFWYNPNIHPYTEYSSRYSSLAEFAAEKNLKMQTLGGYGLKDFITAVFAQMARPARCEICYGLRLEKTAAFAAENGYQAFSTSLLGSPYQDHETIRRFGEEAAAKYGITFFYSDFRACFYESKTAARSRGMYMQKYCGCIFSEEERYLKQ